MKIPTISGIIRRRILLNYRVDPEVVGPILPANFRPKLFGGFAIAGICLIRLEELRPMGFPRIIGTSSENSAHRIAVEWEDAGGRKEGVFVPRRDTNSRFTYLAGGRIFPGVHSFSEFRVSDEDGEISMRILARDFEQPLVEFQASEIDALPRSSAFGSLEKSSAFFEAGSIGYSARADGGELDGLRLKTHRWQVRPLAVGSVRSAFYDDRTIFPEGSIEFDHGLVMRDIHHEWHAEPGMMALARIKKRC